MALPYFEKRYGPYPFKRYSVMDGGQVMGFVALEGYSMATYGTITLTPMVVAHELAHTWWGGIVPNTYLRSWWNEAFASYSDDAFLRMKNRVTARHPTDRPWWPATPSVDGASLSSARHTDNVDAIAYRKGTVVLRLLEDQVGGEETFDRILQAFVRENSGKADPGWPEFRRTVEQVTGHDWGWFFAQWMNLPGWPGLRLENAKVQALPNGERRVTARLVQDNPAYRLSVPVRLETDGEPVNVVVDTAPGGKAAPAVDIVVATSGRPVRLVIDPEFDVPYRFGLDDVVRFDENGKAEYLRSREEQSGMAF